MQLEILDDMESSLRTTFKKQRTAVDTQGCGTSAANPIYLGKYD